MPAAVGRRTAGRRRAGPGEAGSLSIADLLVDDPGQLADSLHQKLIELGLLADVVAGLDEGTLSQGFDVVRQVADSLAAFLGQPLGELVQAAWHTHPDVQAACLRTIGRRGPTQRVDVGRSALESVHRPTVELDVDRARTPLLDVVLSVTLTVEKLPIEIAQGEVVATGAGPASSSVSLSVARPGGAPHILLSRQIASLMLPAYRRPERDHGWASPGRAGALAGGIPGVRRCY